MVVFTEDETLLMLDLYLHFRQNPENVTTGGVLLKIAARNEIARAMNFYFDRTNPWTESQISGKIKNIRNEYADYKWLSSQPGFDPNGKGMWEEWWADIKMHRPKVYSFKGKLPWPYHEKMGMILGEVPYPNHLDPKVTKLLQDLAVADAEENGDSESETENQAVTANTGGGNTANVSQKRSSEDGAREASSKRRRTLVKSVEQSSAAAVGMARGFQDLIAVFQQQSTKYANMNETGESEEAKREQRQVLAAIAKALEQSTKATAEMAQGYHDLVEFFIRETHARVKSTTNTNDKGIEL